MSEQFTNEFQECEVLQEKEDVVEYGQETLIERVVNKDQDREEQNIQIYLRVEEKVNEEENVDEKVEGREKIGYERQYEKMESKKRDEEQQNVDVPFVQEEVVADIVQVDYVDVPIVQEEVVADIVQVDYVDVPIVQEEVIIQPQLYTPLPVIIDPISIAPSQISPSQSSQLRQFSNPFNPVIQSITPNNVNHPHSLLKQPDQAVIAFEQISSKQQLEYQQQEFISQNTMNALCSPLLPGQYTFPVPQSNFVAEEELNREIQRERFQLEPKRVEYEVFQENRFEAYQAQRQIKVAKRQLQNIGVVNQFQVQKEYVYNPPQFIEIETNEIEEEQMIIDKQIAAKSREIQLEKAIINQERQSRQKQALERAQLERQAQVFRLKPQKIVQSEINVYNQPINLDKFTVQNAVAYKDPSILLQSAIYYSQFFEWKQGLASLSTTELKFPDKSTRTSDVNKLKITKESGVNNSRKIKVNYFTQFYIFSIDSKAFINDLPLHYYWFAKIITEKMHLKGCDLNNPYLPESVNTNINVKNQLIDGILYKKSQYFGKWELRYIAITASGLFSFKDQTGGETFSIRKDTATELWTRFQVYERMLIIKIHHSNRKTEFGIPIVDYCIEGAQNWLYAFYRLVYGQ